MSTSNTSYQYSTDWFSHNIQNLAKIFQDLKPIRILEVGSFEGRSTSFFIEEALKYQPSVEIYCLDTWQGGLEHAELNMMSVEERSNHNIALTAERFPQSKIVKYKAGSHEGMMNLLVQNGNNIFDFIYIDGSHEAPDVLLDALLAHKLVRKEGIIAFDDYCWSPDPITQQHHYTLVKPAVDHYVNTYQRKVHVMQGLPLYQLYVMKLAD